MATPLADMIARIRQDLHDGDAAAYRWTDAILQRHIEAAVQEYSFASPVQTKTTVSTAASSRDLSLSSITPRIAVFKVEYPVGYYPSRLVPFSVFGEVLTMMIDTPPAGVENAYIFWGKAHAIVTATTTIPSEHQYIVEIGAAVKAINELAEYSPNLVNIGGTGVWADYLAWAAAAETRYRVLLDKIDYRKKMRVFRIQPGA